MLKDTINVTGELNLKVTNSKGIITEERVVKNLVVTTGKNWIANRLKTSGIQGEMTHMSIGKGTTAAAIGNTSLVTELARSALNVAGGTVANNTITYEATFLAGAGTDAITEAGIFNASPNGTMLCRTVFLPINKGADDTLSISWTITIS